MQRIREQLVAWMVPVAMDMVQDLLDDVWLSNRSYDLQPATALGAQLIVYLKNPPESLCPG